MSIKSKATMPLVEKWQQLLFQVSESKFRELVKEENVSDRLLVDSVVVLKEWFEKEPHLPDIELDTRSAERFLSINKFSIEKTKKKLDNMYTAKNAMPELFSDRDPWKKGMCESFDSSQWIIIPKITPENYRVQIIRVVGEPDTFYPLEVFVSSFMVADIRLSMEIVLGDIYIWDLSNLKFGHAIKMTPTMLKKSMFLIQHCYGARIKAFHIINIPSYAEFLIVAIRSALKKKVAERVYIHKNMDELFNYVSKEYIPMDMGGTYPKTSFELIDNIKTVMKSPECRQWYLDSMSHKTDETRRSGQSETLVDDLLGLKGSFRKLDID